MKKLTVCIMAAFLSLTFIPMQLRAGTEPVPMSMAATKAAEAVQANTLLSRLNEINSMDKSALNTIEKKQLREEVRSIKTQLEHLGSGVYISVGAIIIILLLLIILL